MLLPEAQVKDLTMKIHRTAAGVETSYVLDQEDQDIGQISGGRVVYPNDVARNLVSAIRGRDQLQRDLALAERELAGYRVSAKDLKPIDLRLISSDSNRVFTQIQFEDDELREIIYASDQDGRRPWLTFGECSIYNESRMCYLGARILDGIKDYEHDTPYVVRIHLIGLSYRFTSGHISHFEANLTTDPKDILIHEPDFDPLKVLGLGECDQCEDKHLVLPEGYFVPPVYKLARLVAGRRVSIMMGSLRV